MKANNTTITLDQALKWADSPEGQAEAKRIAAIPDSDIDYSELPEWQEETFKAAEVAQARQSTGMTQQEFAKVMGVSVRTLQNWEQGRRKPSGAAATLLKIAARHPEAIRELRSQP